MKILHSGMINDVTQLGQEVSVFLWVYNYNDKYHKATIEYNGDMLYQHR